jgi:hypothetical protein
MSADAISWPESNRGPQEGENDFYETNFNLSRNPFYAFIHHPGNSATAQDSSFTTQAPRTGTAW